MSLLASDKFDAIADVCTQVCIYVHLNKFKPQNLIWYYNIE